MHLRKSRVLRSCYFVLALRTLTRRHINTSDFPQRHLLAAASCSPRRVLVLDQTEDSLQNTSSHSTTCINCSETLMTGQILTVYTFLYLFTVNMLSISIVFYRQERLLCGKCFVMDTMEAARIQSEIAQWVIRFTNRPSAKRS